jgi:hypothetical protein
MILKSLPLLHTVCIAEYKEVLGWNVLNKSELSLLHTVLKLKSESLGKVSEYDFEDNHVAKDTLLIMTLSLRTVRDHWEFKLISLFCIYTN